MAAAVGVAPSDVRQRRHLVVHPPVAVSIAIRQHPVAHGERGVHLVQCSGDARQHARRMLGLAVVEPQCFAVHFREPHQPVLPVLGLQMHCKVLRHGGCEAHAAQAFVVNVDHGD